MLPQVLQQIRGQEDVELEFQDIILQTREANAIKHPLAALFKPCYRPQLVISTFIAITQQLTGINAIMFYAPQGFSTFGSGRKAALLNTVIIGAGQPSNPLLSSCLAMDEELALDSTCLAAYLEGHTREI